MAILKKRFFLPILLCCVFELASGVSAQSVQASASIGASNEASTNFGGEWHWEHADSDFTLTLEQHGTNLTGRHEAVAMQGGRVDSVEPEDPPSIQGTVSGNSATVHFSSGYSDATGTARLTLQGDKLQWKILSSEGGEHWLPDTALLVRAGSGQQGSVKPGDLVGVWQVMEGMAAGWADAYQFFADNKFVFHTSQMNLKERLRSYSGTWHLEKDMLKLTIREETRIVGGAPRNDGTEWSDEIAGGKEQRAALKSQRTQDFELKRMPASSSGYPSLMLGKTQIWRHRVNPFEYP